MTMKVFNVGDVLAAADVNEYLVNTIYATKPGDTSRATNTTLTNDPDLSVALGANKSYEVEAYIQYLALSTPNIKMAFTVPAGASFGGHVIGLPVGGGSLGCNGVDATTPVTTTFHFAGASPFETAVRYSGILSTAGSAGSFTLQWAQDTTSASTTIIRAGSSLLLRRVA